MDSRRGEDTCKGGASAYAKDILRRYLRKKSRESSESRASLRWNKQGRRKCNDATERRITSDCLERTVQGCFCEGIHSLVLILFVLHALWERILQRLCQNILKVASFYISMIYCLFFVFPQNKQACFRLRRFVSSESLWNTSVEAYRKTIKPVKISLRALCLCCAQKLVFVLTSLGINFARAGNLMKTFMESGERFFYIVITAFGSNQIR